MSEHSAEQKVLQTRALRWGHAGNALGSGLDLVLHPGEMITIIGPNGAGKSSLLKTLAGSLAPLAGKVLLQGEQIDALAPRERARRVAVLPQTPMEEMGLTVRELVALGRTPYLGLWGTPTTADNDAVDQAITLCNLGDLETRRLDRLSGGERQRAQLALVVAQQAPLLLLDEPSTHLDLRWRHLLYELLQQLRREMALTVVCVLHEVSDAFSEADRVLLVADGTATELSRTDPTCREQLAQAFGVPPSRIAPL